MASSLKCTLQYVRQLIKNGKLNAERKGTQWLVSQESINQYLKLNDVVIEPEDHPRVATDLPNIIALSFFQEQWD